MDSLQRVCGTHFNFSSKIANSLCLNPFFPTYAIVFSKLRSISIGCVLRNFIGDFILAMTIPIHLNSAPKEAEIMGVKEALS